jgi:sigma-E factor negative regulatory protein RseC
MIEETGIVLDAAGDWADVETSRQGACGSCSANGACATSLLARYLGRKPLLLRAQNRAGAAPGDFVVVGVPEDSLVRASLAAYLVPLLGLIFGGLAGQVLFPAGGDGASAFTAFAGLGLGLVWLARFGRAHAQDPYFRAVILRRVPGPGVAVAFPAGGGSDADTRRPLRGLGAGTNPEPSGAGSARSSHFD